MLRLLVLKSTPSVGIEALVGFYSIFGLRFVKEKHGKGSLHYSATLENGLVIEIYPSKSDIHLAAALRLGFEIEDMQHVLTQVIEKGGKLLSAPIETEFAALNAVVEAPDGVKIELYQEYRI